MSSNIKTNAVVGSFTSYFVVASLALFMSFLSLNVLASGGSLWGKSDSGGFSLYEQDEPEFLPVDEAFQFDSEVKGDQLILRWDITEGYYLYESRLTVKDSTGKVLNVKTVEGQSIEKDDPAFGLVQVYYNQWAVAVAPIVEGDIKITYQGCADAGLCYPPTSKTVFWNLVSSDDSANLIQATNSSVSTTSEGSSESGVASFMTGGFVLTVLTFLAIGLGLAFTPCVLPMLPILSSVVVNHQGEHKHSAFFACIAYVLGMAITYSALGVAMAGLGDAVQMQAWLQQPWVVGIFAAIFVALALAMFGLYELQLPEFIRSRLTGAGDGTKNHGLLGCVILGVISALVVSPCVSGPLAGVLIYISTTQDMLLGGAALFAMAVGMGLPLMVIVLGGKRVLPKAGVWMEQVKVVFGVLLLLMALYLVKHLLSTEILAILVAVILLVFTIWAGLLDSITNSLYRGVLLVVFVYSLMLFASGLSGKASFDAPLSFVASSEAGTQSNAQESLDVAKVNPGTQLDQLMAMARSQGKPVMLDVLADWCVSCFVMEKEILVKPDVQAMMSGMEIIKVDITDVADENANFLKEQNLFGPPAFLFYGVDGNEIGRIVGEVTKSEFVQYYQSLNL